MENLRINQALAVCANTKISSEERANLIMEGRVLLLEHMGRVKNDALVRANRAPISFGSTLKTDAEYNAAADKWGDDLLYFIAKKVNDLSGLDTDRNDRRTFTRRNLVANPLYLRLLADAMNEIMYSVTPYLISEIVGEMTSVVTVERGKTYQAEITSNAVFQWEDATWTSLRSVPQDRLYNRTVTLNPRPFACRATVNFYQMIGNGANLVDTMGALAGGYATKVMQLFTTAFSAAAADTRYVPSSLKASGYTDDNWANLVRNVAMANRVRRDQIIGYGDFLALRKVLPSNASLASAIMMTMGDEYFKNGFLMSHDGVMLYEITPTATPATINTTLTGIFPTNQIVLAARANTRYAPMIMAWEDNGDASIDLTPADDVMATGRIEVLQVASADIAPAFASRIGLLSSIV